MTYEAHISSRDFCPKIECQEKGCNHEPTLRSAAVLWQTNDGKEWYREMIFTLPVHEGDEERWYNSLWKLYKKDLAEYESKD